MSLIDVSSKPRVKKYDLEHAPGGWVSIRRLTHGQRTERIDVSLTYVPRPSGKEDGEAGINQMILREYDFKHAIVDHNLSIDGRKLNFNNSEDVGAMDGDVGDEIAELIDEHQVHISEEEERFPENGDGQVLSSDFGESSEEATPNHKQVGS